jgi:dTDP-4-amino-4,6-dideoxygalactose transaminase
MTIPFNRPGLAGNEWRYLSEALEAMHISGDGAFTKKCQGLLEEELGAARVLLTTSCTAALEMTALLLNLRPGDEVIVPSFAFVSTVNAYVLRGALPVFCDIRPDTLNLDETKIEALITPRTKGIVLVHYAGIGAEMEVILRLADNAGIPVIEDNAHGLFGKRNGRYLGSFGQLATQSFHETKNFFCGEGGALVINEAMFVDRAEVLWEKGTNRKQFFQGLVDKYSWIDIGSSFLPSDLLAAFLYAQLEARQTVQSKRGAIWRRYHDELREWALENRVEQPYVPEECENPYHMYYLLLPDGEQRNAFIRAMNEMGIMCVFHYLPLHLSQMGMRFGGRAAQCPVTESVSDRIVRLPFFTGMTNSEIDTLIAAIKTIRLPRSRGVSERTAVFAR